MSKQEENTKIRMERRADNYKNRIGPKISKLNSHEWSSGKSDD